MALLFLESFDVTTTILDRWNQMVTGVGLGTVLNVTFGAGNGRFGSGGFNTSSNFVAGNTFGAIKKLLGIGPAATLVVGVAFRASAFRGRILELQDSADVACVNVYVQADGRVSLRRGTTVLGTTTQVLVPARYYYVEVKATTASGTGGSAELRVDGVTWLALAGINTQGGSVAGCDRLLLGQPESNGQGWSYQFDDLYVADTTGGADEVTDFAGDTRVQCVSPDASGAHGDWTPNTGTDWQAVDERPSNGDTDYLSSSTVGHTSTFSLASVVGTQSRVRGVQVSLYVRKDDAGTRAVAPVARSGGTDDVGTPAAVGSAYAYVSQIFTTDSGGAAWTASSVDAAEFGVQLTT